MAASTTMPGAQYVPTFDAAGAKYHVSPWLLYEMARQESGFNPTAKSPAGAIGIMQFEPGTAAGLGVDPTDPTSSIYGAARLMSRYLKTYNGSQTLALAAYNAGAGAVQRYGGVPPYPQTQEYVSIISQRVAADEKRAARKQGVAPGRATIETVSAANGAHKWGTGKGSADIGGLLSRFNPLNNIGRVVVTGVIVLGGAGLAAAGLYQTVTGRRAHPIKAAEKGAQVAATAAAL